MCAHLVSRARRTILDQTLAKEGEIAVGRARQIPLDEPAAGPLTDRAAPGRVQAPTSAPSARWPVLARIAEVARTSEQLSASAQASPRATYRVDAPHASAPSPSHATPQPPARPLQTSASSTRLSSPKSVEPRSGIEHPNTDEAEPQGRILPAVPLSIQIAVGAWQLIQPHGALIRFAATLALMAAGGMSMVMMGERVGESPRSAATTADHTTAAESETQSAELYPVLEPATNPSTDTSLLEPTATGPITPASKPLMAVEASVTPPTPIRPAPIYPTTPYAAATLPVSTGDSLPQVRTTEPEIARLRGDILKTQTR